MLLSESPRLRLARVGPTHRSIEDAIGRVGRCDRSAPASVKAQQLAHAGLSVEAGEPPLAWPVRCSDLLPRLWAFARVRRAKFPSLAES